MLSPSIAEGLPILWDELLMKKQKAIFYIDGFNLYFGLRGKNWKKHYWLDLVNFCQKFLKPHQELIEVKYFTAIQKSKGKQDRQDLFLPANELNEKFHLFLGKYLPKKINHDGAIIKTF